MGAVAFALTWRLDVCTGMPAKAAAGEFPWRPIHLVVAGSAGGSADLLARMVVDDMAKSLRQQIIIDNRPGASGMLAAEAVARAAPDGHTLMLSWIGNATGQSLIAKVRVDINRDFTHILQLASGCNVLMTHPGSGFKTLEEMLRKAKAHPGGLSYASAGNGSSGHLSMELLKQRARISLVHVPYRGGMPALNDLLGGQVDLMFVNQDAVIGYVRRRQLLPLALTCSARNPLFPSVPTVAESGFPGFEVTAWAGLSAPRGTPAAIVQRIRAAALAALHGPLKAMQEAQGAQVVGSTPEHYTAFIQAETAKWAQVIRAAGIKPD